MVVGTRKAGKDQGLGSLGHQNFSAPSDCALDYIPGRTVLLENTGGGYSWFCPGVYGYLKYEGVLQNLTSRV